MIYSYLDIPTRAWKSPFQERLRIKCSMSVCFSLTACTKAVLPRLSSILGSASFSRRYCATALRWNITLYINGVISHGPFALTSAPDSTKNLTIFTWPLREAMCSAVALERAESFRFTSTSFSLTRYLILSWSPLSAASCRGKVLLLEVSMALSKLLFSSTV